jgi:hypothetical protein
MIRSLLRRNTSLRSLGRWVIIGPITSMTFLGVMLWARFATKIVGSGWSLVDFLPMALALWFPAAIDLGVATFDRRLSRFDMALPVPSRQLWLAHTLALIMSGVTVVAITGAFTGLMAWFLGVRLSEFPDDAFAIANGIYALGLRTMAATVLTVVVFQNIRPALAGLPRTGRTGRLITAILLCYLPLILVLGALPVAWSLIPLALAFVLALRTFRSLPGTFVLHPREPGFTGVDSGAVYGADPRKAAGTVLAAHAGADAAEPRGRGSFRLLVSTIYRSTTKMPVAPLLGFPLLILMGLGLSGLRRAIDGGEIMRFIFVFITSYMFLAFSGLPPRKLYVLDPLPISRRAIFSVVALPLIAALSLGYGAGRIWADVAEGRREHIRYAEQECCSHIVVPFEICEISWDGETPHSTAPWGERYEFSGSLLREGGTVRISSPHAASGEQSIEFVALQISRAAEAIYGTVIPPSEIAARYLETDDVGLVVLKGDGLTLARDYPDLDPRPKGPVFPAMMMVVLVLWLVAFAAYLRTLRPAVPERVRKSVYWGSMMLLLAAHTAQFIMGAGGAIRYATIGGFWEILISDIAEALPGGRVAVWLLCGLIVYGVYKLAERQFERAECLPGDDRHIDMTPLLSLKGKTSDSWQ